ncbi:zinc dependent phospholipase C family protein [Pseudodesulfovibrio piezophilus]|uniref:Phospholipase C/D domain-containing protein n=1 Tax=Pseudodesulfovibrio piezophilus (strain DSM 21447 / JCM 15486 / C1TLV30) TaxID=1322246 RepID=M1WNU3_PSEP2|nr:zinc dependent phospholipase C family protein [Pseudodesulfovibrio piezophilus]CCH50590.1 conserved protein of unknown function [Pseudodesulfovibrio piezophilus C1TLV30]
MPKELIHFSIAELTAARLEDSQYAACIAQEPNGLLLGSIFHDALFYAVMPGGKRLEALSHQLHGVDGQDTFHIVTMQLQQIQSVKSTALPISVLVGMVSHLFADTIMHPFVWYFTGNYYDQSPSSKSIARQRHRALESLMDMVVCPQKIKHPTYCIKNQLKKCNKLISKGLPVHGIADMAKMPSANVMEQLGTAWSIFSTLQTLTTTGWIARTTYGIKPYSPAVLKEIISLFYAPQLLEQGPFLAGEIDFSHPVTGKKKSTTLTQMMNEAADLAGEFCLNLEATVFDGAPSPPQPRGPSLDTGFASIPTNQMIHFSSPPFPDLS